MVSEPVLQPLAIHLSRAIADHQVYDWLTALDREVEHIWQSKWSVSKILFIISRYGTFIDLPIFIASESDFVHHRMFGMPAEILLICSKYRSIWHDRL